MRAHAGTTPTGTIPTMRVTGKGRSHDSEGHPGRPRDQGRHRGRDSSVGDSIVVTARAAGAAAVGGSSPTSQGDEGRRDDDRRDHGTHPWRPDGVARTLIDSNVLLDTSPDRRPGWADWSAGLWPTQPRQVRSISPIIYSEVSVHASRRWGARRHPAVSGLPARPSRGQRRSLAGKGVRRISTERGTKGDDAP